jgi:hypothetical protein
VRIRSIKPEFWRSEDVAALDLETRLLFIGLWSYVDDNGVGRDDGKIITAELFALDDFTESSLRVHGGLNTLHSAGLIQRYGVAGKRYLSVTNFGKHQVINRPSKARYPLPTREDAELTEPSLDAHGALTEGSRLRAVEQGSSGSVKKTPSSADADALFEEFWSLYPKKVEKQATRRKWDSTVKRVDPLVIISGLRRYVEYWDRKRTERQFIKGPEVWLNKGCWADELDEDGELSASGSWFPGA